MVVKEEQAVGASVLVNLYTDIEYLLTYAGQYRAAYAKTSRLLDHTKQDTVSAADIPGEQQATITALTDTIRTQAYKVHMRIKAVAPKIGVTVPETLDKHFQALWDGLILDPQALDRYVQDLMQLLADQVFSSAVVTAAQTLKGLGE